MPADQLDPYEADLADDWDEPDDYDWRDLCDLPVKEEPDCPACCDSGWRDGRPCRSCSPTRWAYWRWRLTSRLRWRLSAWWWRLRSRYSDEPPF